MKRKRVNDINGDCQANPCPISPLCTTGKASAASKISNAAVISPSLRGEESPVPHTELGRGQPGSAGPSKERGSASLLGTPAENHGRLTSSFFLAPTSRRSDVE